MRAIVVSATLFASAYLHADVPSFRQTQVAPIPNRLPILDNTSFVHRTLPNGEREAQSATRVGPGASDRNGQPTCVDLGLPGAKLSCVDLCVSLPRGSKVNKVEAFAHGLNRPWEPCNQRSCIESAAFDSVGPRSLIEEGRPRTCWAFRNWHLSETRHALLAVTFRPPSDAGDLAMGLLIPSNRQRDGGSKG